MHQDCLDFLLANQPLNDVRLRVWERKFPGCGDDFGEIFGTQQPSPREVAEWKASWIESTPYKFYFENENEKVSWVSSIRGRLYSDDLKNKIHNVCHEVGIHPYFWEFWKDQREEQHNHDNGHVETLTVLVPYVSFYKDEYLVMFKLRW